MQKHEFEERIESTVSDEDYKLIEFVYQFHPVIRNVSGKDEVAELYKSFGMCSARATSTATSQSTRFAAPRFVLSANRGIMYHPLHPRMQGIDQKEKEDMVWQ